ncbi:glycosyl transferase, family I [Desulfosarcina variabilis str. Montpellier]|uniref:glycosyltransferase n=1 Tax=Desulfosarcina variabilis TaxID=2300 RepID=UPI003AFAE0E3
MNIFYITDVFPLLSQTFVLREINALEELGQNIAVLSLIRRPISDPDHAIMKRLKALRFYGPDLHPEKIQKAIYHFRAFRKNPKGYLEALRLSKTTGLPIMKYLFRDLATYGLTIERFGAQHLHAHFGRVGMLAAWLLGKMLNLPFSVTLHGSDALVDPYPAIGRVLQDASRVICVSGFIQKKVVSDFGVSNRKTTIIYNGIDPNEFIPAEVLQKELRIITVARLHPVKCIPDLVDGLALLEKKGINFQCTIVGEGEERNKIEAQIQSLGMEKNVKLLGGLRNEMLPSILKEHNLFVMPSSSEGLGVALLEALSCGLPVVATRVGGIPEIIKDGINGILVSPNSPNEIADAIMELHQITFAHKEKMAKANRKKIEEDFNVFHQAEKLLQFFINSEK